MKIEFFDKDKHYGMVLDWWGNLNKGYKDIDDLPPTGLVAFDDDGNGLAAGFMIKTDGKFYIMEDYIANINANRKERNKSIDMIILAFEEIARKEGVNGLIGMPSVNMTVERAKKLGWSEVDRNCRNIYKRIA